eukprot:Hpha_TRINITY_DN15635_c2_g1::TRINITY_DN15635_c2_g1_i1::g.101873::m.101873
MMGLPMATAGRGMGVGQGTIGAAFGAPTLPGRPALPWIPTQGGPQPAGGLQTVPNTNQGPNSSPCLPFDIRTRSVIDTIARAPHRAFLPEDLQQVEAHWVDVSASDLSFLREYTTVEQDNVKVLPPPEKAAVESEVDARVLLVTGVSPEHAYQHVARGVEIIATAVQNAQGRPSLSAYGGAVKEGSDDAIRAELTGLVASQCGLQLAASDLIKFVEFRYTSGRRAVFYIARKLGPPGQSVSVHCQAHEKVEELEEEVEVLDEEADKKAEEEWEAMKKAGGVGPKLPGGVPDAAAVPDAVPMAAAVAMEADVPSATVVELCSGERQRVTKKVKMVREKVTREKTQQPMRVHLGHCLEYKLTRLMSLSTIELCLAIDALDEFLKKEMLQRAYAFILKHEQRKALEKEADRMREIPVEQRKRLYDQEDVDLKRRRTQEADEFLAKWKLQDTGKSDEEQRMLEWRRKEWIAEQHRQKDTDLAQERLAREDETRANVDAGIQKVNEGGGWFLVKAEEDAEAAGAFQYLDRGNGILPTGALPLRRLEELLLCLPSAYSSLSPVSQLLDDAVPAKAQATPGQVNYRILCTTRKVKATEPPPESGPSLPAKEAE